MSAQNENAVPQKMKAVLTIIAEDDGLAGRNGMATNQPELRLYRLGKNLSASAFP